MKKPKPIVPTESFEQEQLVQWLEARNYRFTAIPNAIPSQALRLKHARQGLRPGLPDMLILVNNRCVWIELKRAKPASSRVSDTQKTWLTALNNAGCVAQVCYGFEEAKQFVLAQQST